MTSRFSRVLNLFSGNTRGANPVKALRERSLRMESLEDRALLSVTTGSVTTGSIDASLFDDVQGKSIAVAGVLPDVPISLSAGAEGSGAEAAEQPAAATNAIANDAIANDAIPSDAALTGTVPNGALPDITNLVAEASGYSITVSWDPVPGATNYVVYYGIGPIESWTWSKTLNLETSTFTITATESGTYTFGIYARNISGDECEGVAVSVAVPGAEQLLPPSNFKAPIEEDDGQFYAIMTWDVVEGASNYSIQLCTDGESWEDWQTTESGGRQQMTIKLPGGDYWFRIRSNGDNSSYKTSVYSDPIKVVFPAQRLDTPEILETYYNDEGKIFVEWEEVYGASSYEVRYSPDAGETWYEGPSGLTSTSATLDVGAGCYVIEVKARGDGTRFNDSYSAETWAARLSTPTNVVAQAYKYTITITWDEVEADTEVAYMVYYSLDSGATWECWTAHAISENMCRFGAPQSTASYMFKVQAVDNHWDEYESSDFGYSNPVDVPAIPQLEIPVISVSLDSPDSEGRQRVVISWERITNANRYSIQYSVDDGQSWESLIDRNKTNRYSEFFPGGHYTFRVSAVDIYGEFKTSDYSAPVSIDVPPQPLSPPRSESIQTVYDKDNELLTVSWGGVWDASGFTVQYSSDGGNTWSTGGTDIQALSTQLNLSPGTYLIRIKAQGDGEAYRDSAYCEPVFVSTLPSLATPKITSLEGVFYEINVCWDPVKNATGYKVYCSSDNGSTWDDYQTEGPEYTSATIMGSDGKYLIKVQALGDGKNYGDSEFSTVVSITLPVKVGLPTPTNLKAAFQSDNTISVSWESVPDAGSYTLLYRKTTDSDWTTVANLTDAAYTITGAEPGMIYQVRVKAVPSNPNLYTESDYAEARAIPPLDDWNLADYEGYTDFTVEVIESHVFLYGSSKDLPETSLKDDIYIDPGEAKLTIYGNNTARNIKFTVNALTAFREIIYVGGKSKKDTITLEGSEFGDKFTFDQETLLADVHESPTKAPKAQKVTFDTVSLYVDGYGQFATVKMSGVRSVLIDAKKGDDTFNFYQFGTTYDLIGGDGEDRFDFSKAKSGVKLDLGKTKTQSVLGKGKLCLHGDIESVRGSLFKDTITTAANTREVRGYGGADTVKLVGNADTETWVYLNGYSQRVTAKGAGWFYVGIEDGAKSTVRASSVSSAGSLTLEAKGDKISVVGTKGNDRIGVEGDNASVQGNDGDDYIKIIGTTAKASGGKGDDLLILSRTYGKCTLDGGAGNDILVGGAGNDVLKASSGNNILIGNAGGDKLTGGRGRDLLIANSTPFLLENTPDSYGLSDEEEMFYRDLIRVWLEDGPEYAPMLFGNESVADHKRDTLKRGGGENNLFYANPLEDDFDTFDLKEDKGDLLYSGAKNGKDKKDEEAAR